MGFIYLDSYSVDSGVDSKTDIFINPKYIVSYKIIFCKKTDEKVLIVRTIDGNEYTADIPKLVNKAISILNSYTIKEEDNDGFN